MKTCSKCKVSKPRKSFSKDCSRKDGLQASCRSCKKEYRKTDNTEYYRQWANDNTEKRREYNKQWKKANPEKVRNHNKKYRENNLEKRRISTRVSSNKWKKANPGMCRAYTAKRRAAKLERTPSWSNIEEIKAFYVACPESYQVDHIIPLQGETVSGLHVLNNLQYLPAKDNLSKGNRV